MGEQQISFSLHAIDVIEQREILIEWVARILAEPSLVRPEHRMDPRLLQAFGSVPERDNRVLRVVEHPELDLVWW